MAEWDYTQARNMDPTVRILASPQLGGPGTAKVDNGQLRSAAAAHT